MPLRSTVLVVLIAASLDGCCCSVIEVANMKDGKCFIESYNCKVSDVTHLHSTEVACTPAFLCELSRCTASGDCVRLPPCLSAVECGASIDKTFGDTRGGVAACRPSPFPTPYEKPEGSWCTIDRAPSGGCDGG